MKGVAPYPKHCFHEMSGEQRGEDFRCCFCNVEEREWNREGHGRFYVGAGELIDNNGKDCPERKALNDRD